MLQNLEPKYERMSSSLEQLQTKHTRTFLPILRHQAGVGFPTTNRGLLLEDVAPCRAIVWSLPARFTSILSVAHLRVVRAPLERHRDGRTCDQYR